MIKHDTSLEELHTNDTGGTGFNTAPSSAGGASAAPSRKMQLSVRASVKSSAASSFRHFIEKLNPSMKKHRPIRNLAELSERLDRRGAADENLWIWCENILKRCKNEQKEEEGVLQFKGRNFPCPLMKSSIEIPLKCLLVNDPSYVGPVIRKKVRNISTGTMNVPNAEEAKRYHLWSRDFSSLYKVLKVASYQL